MTKYLMIPFAVLVSGCYKINYTTGPAKDMHDAEITHNTFIYGIVEPDEIDLDEICPKGFQRIEHEITGINYLYSTGVQVLASFTGIGALPIQWYGPHTVRVYCDDGSAKKSSPPPAELTEDEEDLKSLQDKVKKTIEDIED